MADLSLEGVFRIQEGLYHLGHTIGDQDMYKNILVPVLLDDENDNRASFDAAIELADDSAKITIIHVVEPIPNYALAEIPKDVLERTHAERTDALSKMARFIDGSETKLISGHAGNSIVDYANDTGADCIVVASHRPGVADYFLGSTAARVVRHAKCSVHVIR
jgi:universal stress protein F